MEIKYDLHIHTGLSPCAILEMTPNNIVNMALINGLDVIGITDHNSCEQIESIIQVASNTNLLILPGIEVETIEEVHILCLFSSLEAVCSIQKKVYEGLPAMKNRTDIFGEQILYSNEDDKIGISEYMLSFATNISLENLVEMTEKYNGVCIPAHIDRPSYSIISNLGMLPEHLDFPTLEVSKYADIQKYKDRYPNHRIIQSSDAHELGHIGECEQKLTVTNRSVEAVLEELKRHKE